MGFFDSVSKIHVIGAGGIGLSALTKLLHSRGKCLSASDYKKFEGTDEIEMHGIHVAIGTRAENIPSDAEVVIYSDAYPEDDPERVEAKRRGLRQMSYFEALGELSKEMHTIAVSGTNGKSTTTAMLGLLLERAGLDPTIIVGSKVNSFPDKNLRIGKSQYFVVEADEFHAHMVELSPQMIVLTNIEEDHLDYYRDLAHIRETFQKFVDRLPPDGSLIVNADDHISFFELKPKAPFVTYALDSVADYQATDITVGHGKQRFVIRRKNASESMGEFEMRVPGRFNVANALAAATAAFELGVSKEVIFATLAEFTGIWRRFENVSERNGVIVISDYGHHPTAVRGTIEAARSFYPGRRMVLVFQPHQRNRTKNLFQEFVAACDGADVVVLPEIYYVPGREESEDQKVSSNDLVEAVRTRDLERGVNRPVAYAETLDITVSLVNSLIRDNDLVLCMGAGDIYTVTDKIGV